MNRTPLTHIDLFSGIGGFIEAAQRAGLQTIGACEINEKCRKYLVSRYEIPVHDDVRTINYTSYKGVNVITGGPPCQPASLAGLRKGAGDNRWLWPEAVRAIREAGPDGFIYENPPGIRTMGLDGICSELEVLGYEIQVFNIPACAVNASHIRKRYWIVGIATGTTNHERRSKPHSNSEWNEARPEPERRGVANETGGTSNTDRFAEHGKDRDLRQNTAFEFADIQFLDYRLIRRWAGKEYVVSRVAGTFDGMDDGAGDRKLIEALGNMICVPVAVELLRVMVKALKG